MDEQNFLKNNRGLSEQQVEEKVDKGLVNEEAKPATKSFPAIVKDNVLNPFYFTIAVAVVFLLVYGEVVESLFISVVMGINLLGNIIKEYSARRSLERISLVNQEPITVRRAGENLEVFPSNIVQDELVELISGQFVYVDGEVLFSEHLLLDESALTGESDYVSKKKGEELTSGSFVVSGKGWMKTTRVGREGHVNKVTEQARKYKNEFSPLEQKVVQLVNILTYAALIIVAFLVVMGNRVWGLSNSEITLTVVPVISGMIPQGTILTVTLAFVIGAYRMYRKKLLVQNTSTIEVVSDLDVLCMDKTGTLTKNSLMVEEVAIINEDRKFWDLVERFPSDSVEQNRTIEALRKYFEKSSAGAGSAAEVGSASTKEIVKVLDQTPFTSQSKYSAIKYQQAEIFLGSVAKISELTGDSSLLESSEKYTSKGRRVVAFAARELGSSREVNKKISPLGLISIKDELRTGVKEILNEFVAKGVAPVVISGDSKETVIAIVKRLGIEELNKPISGKELSAIDSKIEHEQAILGHDIFVEVSPEQKVEIIKAFQSKGKKVGMIGDGVNDALAIKQADLGVSMNEGANVTRSIADIILLDNDFRRLLLVIQEGRDILHNTLNAAKLLTVKNFYTIFLIVFSLLLNLAFPFTTRSLVFLSFINANLPIIAFLSDSGEKISGRKFMRELLVFSALGGGVAGTLGIFLSIIYSPEGFSSAAVEDANFARTVILAFVFILAVINYLIIAADSFNPLKFKRDKKTVIVVFSMLVIFFGAMYIRPIGSFFDISAIGIEEWGAALAAAAIYYLVFAVVYGKVKRLVIDP
ncbi:MAG: HAD-IC family P-type ATPase [Candidatus Dojkabacteria bacterium]